MPEPPFSICHTTARPDGWRASYEAWLENAARPDQVEYILTVDKRWGFERFPRNLRPCDKVVWNTGRKCLVDGANLACANATGQILIVNSDDMCPCKDWDRMLLEAIGRDEQYSAPMNAAIVDRDFVVRTHPGDKYQAWLDDFVKEGRDPIIGRLMTLQILSRARYQRFGYALYPEFTSMMADTDFTAAAEHDGVVIEAQHVTVEHRHPFVTGETQDAVSKHENEAAAHALGSRIYARRQQERTGAAVTVMPAKLPKLAVMLPGDSFSWTWTDAWSRLLLHLVHKFELAFTFESCSNQYFARDFAFQALLRHNKEQNWKPDFALWIDSDNILTPDQFDLLYDAIENVPIISAVGGWYWIDVQPPQVCARVREKNGEVRSVTIEELQDALDNLKLIEITDHMGFGSLLMRWEVMATAGQWPFTPMLQDRWKQIMMAPIPENTPATLGPYKGDDVSFCHRAMFERGYRFWLHPEVYLPHLKRKAVDGPKLRPRAERANAAD